MYGEIVIRLCKVFMLLVALLSMNSANANLPNGLFFIGLTDNGWRFFRVVESELQEVADIEHPRSGTYHPALNRIAFIGSDHQFREYQLDTGELSVIKPNSGDATRYAQPRYSHDGGLLLAVELPDGRSRQTIIVGIDTASGIRYEFVRKRTAQFEPQMRSPSELFYTTAICVDDCEGMIWELWHRDMLSAQQKQLTLMNAVARQPHRGHDGWLYFSSNAGAGHYNIWRMKPSVGSPPEQLTNGPERDSNPATDKAGNLYFLRKLNNNTSIMQRAGEQLSELALPESIKDIRFLEVAQ